MNEYRSSRSFALTALALAATMLPRVSDAAGEIRWFSLLTEDRFTAVRFYSNLFGWDIDDSPAGAGALMAVRNGVPIAGLSQIEDRLPGVSESMWLAAIKVDDVAASVERARALGAMIREGPTRLEGWGTYALIQDPQGAPALLVTTERVLGSRDGYAAWRWAELWTHDLDAASEFYRQVVGYERETVDVGGQPYPVFTLDGVRQAGLVEPKNPDLAPRWAPYVGVTDLRGILVRVWGAGGKVVLEPAEIDSDVAGENRVALIADPTGAMMFLYQLSETATVDPGVQSQQASRTSRPASTGRSGGRNVNVSVQVSYGFGSGWGGVAPGYPYRPYGPPF